MIEPRRGFHMLQERDTEERHLFYSSNSKPEVEEVLPIRVLEHDEPEIPVHPALEYEIVISTIQPALITTTSQQQVVDADLDHDHDDENSSNNNNNATLDPLRGDTIPTTAVALQHQQQQLTPRSSLQDDEEEETSVVVLCDAKLLFSFLGLILFGTLSAVSLKLQAIPMCVLPCLKHTHCVFLLLLVEEARSLTHTQTHTHFSPPFFSLSLSRMTTPQVQLPQFPQFVL